MVADAARICADLVAIRSENPPGRTAEAVEYVRAFLEGIGIRSVVTASRSGHANLVTLGTHGRILFCGHLDVVPAREEEGWTFPPFSGEIRDGSVRGRGATDMKGGCASILAAVSCRAEEGKEVPTCAFVCDEESGGRFGVRHLLARKVIHPTDCLIAEPSPLRHPCIGQKGLCRLGIRFAGTPAHGSLYPVAGVSAVMEAVSFLQYVKGLPERAFPVDDEVREIIGRSARVLERETGIRDGDAVLTRLMFNPGVIRGGGKSNVVAGRCDLDLEIRVPWGCRTKALFAELGAHTRNGTIRSRSAHDPSLTDPSCPLVAITCREVERVHGGEVFPIVQWAASDARHLRRRGFRVIEYGPGVITALHAVDEHVTVASLAQAAEVYGGIMAAYSEDRRDRPPSNAK